MEGFKTGKERLFGYGHRIYKVVDPRSVFIREILDELHEEIAQDPVLKVAMELNRLASTDPYFVSRKLHANADLFASFAYKAMYRISFLIHMQKNSNELQWFSVGLHSTALDDVSYSGHDGTLAGSDE
jgi:hypothetical protein